MNLWDDMRVDLKHFYLHQNKSKLIARGHDTGDRFQINFLRNFLRLDRFFLIRDENEHGTLFVFGLPAVFRDPLVDDRFVHQSEKLAEGFLLDVLVRDRNYVTHELTNGIFESAYASNEVRGHGVHFVPKVFELRQLEEIVEEKNLFDHRFFQVFLAQQALAENEIGMREVGESLHEDLADGTDLETRRIELIQLQEGEVGLEVVSVLFRLNVHVPFQRGDVLGIITFDALEHRRDVGFHSVHRSHRHFQKFEGKECRQHSNC